MLSSCSRGDLDLVVGTYGHNLYEVTFKTDGTFGPLRAIPSENPSFVIQDGPGHYFAVSENDRECTHIQNPKSPLSETIPTSAPAIF